MDSRISEPVAPKQEDFGYESGNQENKGGWTMEGGEEAYFKAVEEYDEKMREYYDTPDQFDPPKN